MHVIQYEHLVKCNNSSQGCTCQIFLHRQPNFTVVVVNSGACSGSEAVRGAEEHTDLQT